MLTMPQGQVSGLEVKILEAIKNYMRGELDFLFGVSVIIHASMKISRLLGFTIALSPIGLV